MSDLDRKRWNEKYTANPARLSEPLALPDDWLVQHASSLVPGRALDVACGLGRNSRWLSRMGWTVDAVDISPVGLAIAAQLAQQDRCHNIQWIEADLDTWSADQSRYDLVIVFRFFERNRLPKIIESSLRPGGLLIYETFSHRHLERPGVHMKNPDFALQPNELRTLFPNLKVLAGEETDFPDRSAARLVAQMRVE